MDFEFVSNMLMAQEAAGEPRPTSPRQIAAFLDEWKELFDVEAIEAWRAVFAWVGGHHQGANRYNIILGIFKAFATFEDLKVWGKTWMMACPSAGIHAVSLPLCATCLPAKFRKCLLAIYRKNFPCAVNPRVLDMDDSKHELDRHWEIVLPPNHPVDDVLSSHALLVREARKGTVRTVGNRWCVRELTLCDMRSLEALGPDLTVQTNLILLLCPKTVMVQQGSIVGGTAFVVPSRFDWGKPRNCILDPGEWKEGLGWEENDYHWVSDLDGNQHWGEPLEDTIVFPDSWFHLYMGYWGEEE